ncbi:uncharacterized protein EV154DRAFT_569005 [Mucor mucedo]|uniref:uncharacterized protein n=1 Tax=Mucor mucedo TaxID=29922 RepID=UPI0022208F48|nr:uncharacterized protein EV154DRAFT_569005 [Mucor mucedo]KAI7877670.1 hypothetical protein EV154DRAFT_569005 [Mucor mucedo]
MTKFSADKELPKLMHLRDTIMTAALDAWVSLEIYAILRNTNEKILGDPVVGHFVVPAVNDYQPEVILESIKNNIPYTVLVDKSLLRSESKRHVDLEIDKKTSGPPSSNNIEINGGINGTYESVVEDNKEDSGNISAKAVTRNLFGGDIEDVDLSNFEYGFNQFKNCLTTSINESTDERLFNRVVRNVFHLMDSIKIGVKHTLKLEFEKNFRNCLFVLDADDCHKPPRGFSLLYYM